MDLTEPPPFPGQNAPIQFTGEDAAFRRLVVRGTLLELVTFGFYRFWLTTDIRRHLWSNTEVDGDAMEYTGRGKELLFGFLIALAILLPAFFAYTFAGIAAERYKAFASLPLYAVLFLFGQFAVFRARRYRLTRTIWRGVRFWMTGSGWLYALRSAAWVIPVLLTLGFAYPWQMASLERYKFRHTHYGTLPARLEATGGQLFKQVWWVWLLGLSAPVAIFGGTILAVVAQWRGETPTDGMMIAAGLLMLVGFILMFCLPFLHAMRKAIEWRWWMNGIRVGAAEIRCSLPSGGLIGVYWTMIGLCILASLGWSVFGGIVAGVFYLALKSVASPTLPAVLGQILGVVWYIAIILTTGVIARIYLMQRVWRTVARSCTLHEVGVLSNVAAAGEAVSAVGEGLADGLDFAGF